jgi:predicted secreted Zn-dependent protease
MAGEQLVSVKGTTIEEFCKNAQKAVREGKGEIGVTTFHISAVPKLEGKTIKTVKFSVEIKIKRAHWTGKADDRQTKAIRKAEELNKAHEGKHRDIAQQKCKELFPDAEKDLIGKSQKELDAKIAEITAEIEDAYADLDRAEGAVGFMDDENKKDIDVWLEGA